MTASSQNQLISLQPDELKFVVELNKQSYCDLKVVNNTEHHVAFKVKTTSPKNYFVRPNTGVVQPWDSCVIRVTLQAQRESPPDMQCKDKFLIQSTIVPAHTDVDELPADTFNKDNSGKRLEEFKIRVTYVAPSASGSADEALRNNTGNPELNSALQRIKDERDAAVHQAQQLQQELDLLKRRRYRKRDPGFSVTFAFVVGLIGLMVGFLMKLLSSSAPAPTTTA